MRKTKIICTIGPASDDECTLRQLMIEGMDVARFNFSHANYEQHRNRFDLVVKLRKELNLPVATLLDTRGPEIRLGKFIDDKPVEIKDGEMYTLTTDDILGDDKRSSITFKNFSKDVNVGTKILINDGMISLEIAKIAGNEIICKIVHGGTLSNNKGVNVPGVKLSMPYISERDMADLEFGAKMNFDFIAASFCRTAADIKYLRNLTQSIGWTTPRIIAKIENMEGVHNIDEILEAADGIMVARGDMGVEIPFELIPAIQKTLIKKAYYSGKQVITATQMLESMITNPLPTRAEITDVANAIYDGTSAIMLSGETAAGKYPIDAVRTMSLIAKSTEKNINYAARFKKRELEKSKTVTNAISHATVMTAQDIDADAIITVTTSGHTARMISKYRPKAPIIGCTPNEIVLRQLNMSWGIIPVLADEMKSTDELFAHSVSRAVEEKLIKEGDTVVITAGVPLGRDGTTNLLKVVTVEK